MANQIVPVRFFALENKPVIPHFLDLLNNRRVMVDERIVEVVRAFRALQANEAGAAVPAPIENGLVQQNQANQVDQLIALGDQLVPLREQRALRLEQRDQVQRKYNEKVAKYVVVGGVLGGGAGAGVGALIGFSKGKPKIGVAIGGAAGAVTGGAIGGFIGHAVMKPTLNEAIRLHAEANELVEQQARLIEEFHRGIQQADRAQIDQVVLAQQLAARELADARQVAETPAFKAWKTAVLVADIFSFYAPHLGVPFELGGDGLVVIPEQLDRLQNEIARLEEQKADLLNEVEYKKVQLNYLNAQQLVALNIKAKEAELIALNIEAKEAKLAVLQDEDYDFVNQPHRPPQVSEDMERLNGELRQLIDLQRRIGYPQPEILIATQEELRLHQARLAEVNTRLKRTVVSRDFLQKEHSIELDEDYLRFQADFHIILNTALETLNMNNEDVHDGENALAIHEEWVRLKLKGEEPNLNPAQRRQCVLVEIGSLRNRVDQLPQKMLRAQ